MEEGDRNRTCNHLRDGHIVRLSLISMLLPSVGVARLSGLSRYVACGTRYACVRVHRWGLRIRTSRLSRPEPLWGPPLMEVLMLSYSRKVIYRDRMKCFMVTSGCRGKGRTAAHTCTEEDTQRGGFVESG